MFKRTICNIVFYSVLVSTPICVAAAPRKIPKKKIGNLQDLKPLPKFIKHVVTLTDLFDVVGVKYGVDVSRIRQCNKTPIGLGDTLLVPIDTLKLYIGKAKSSIDDEGVPTVMHDTIRIPVADTVIISASAPVDRAIKKIEEPIVASSLKNVESIKRINYTVRRGDNISIIAQHYQTTVEAIKQYNKLQSNKLIVGQKLILQQPVTILAHTLAEAKIFEQSPIS